jgi:hypothetical protein
MGEALVRDGRIRRPGTAGRARVLDDLEDAVAAVGEPEDGGLQGHGARDQLAHVALDVVALDEVRRREDGETEDGLVPSHRSLDVGHTHSRVRDPGDHPADARG